MKNCMFCDTALTSANKGKEHVLRRSWLEALDHEKTEIPFDFFSKNGRIGTRRMAAGSLLTGDVCRDCNNGWMNRIDEEVDHIVLAAAKDPESVLVLDERDKRNLARWLLKTYLTFVYTDSRDRRHVDPRWRVSIQIDGWLPNGFFMFAALANKAVKDICAVSADVWLAGQYAEITQLPQSSRAKFGVMYDRILLGFAWVDLPVPTYSALGRLHVPLLTQTSYVILTEDELRDTLGRPDLLPTGMSPHILNKFLVFIGLKSVSHQPTEVVAGF